MWSLLHIHYSVLPDQVSPFQHFFCYIIFSPAFCLWTATIRSSVGAKVYVNLPDCNCTIKAVYQQGLGQSVCSDASCYKITSVVQTDTVISASFWTGFLQSWLGVSSGKNLYFYYLPKHSFCLQASSKVTTFMEMLMSGVYHVNTGWGGWVVFQVGWFVFHWSVLSILRFTGKNGRRKLHVCIYNYYYILAFNT